MGALAVAERSLICSAGGGGSNDNAGIVDTVLGVVKGATDGSRGESMTEGREACAGVGVGWVSFRIAGNC